MTLWRKLDVARTSEGVGGWLAVFCLLTGFLFPLRALTDAAVFHRFADRAAQRIPGLAAMADAYSGVYLVLSILAVITSIVLVLHTSHAVDFAKAFLLLVPMATVALVLLPGLAHLNDTEQAEWFDGVMLDFVISLAMSLAWLAYFSVSRRVKMTYSH